VRAGDNLYTNSRLALNPDSGALFWYFQFTPHDTHDWDSNHVRHEDPRRFPPPGRAVGVDERGW
jgi:hypothetical protein